jgi:hypothetical protein
MAKVTPIQVHKGRRIVPGPDPRVDTLLGMVMALTSEVSVLRERLETHESLSGNGQQIDHASIDSYEPSSAEEERRQQQRQRLLEKVCRPLIASDHQGA